MEGVSSSALFTSTSWPFQRTQGTGSSGDVTSSLISTVSALKEPKAFGDITVKQAEWEKQMESADQKQTELFHFQWNLIREQLANLTREIATTRQDFETIRATESRREVREADFARVVRETQAELEKENASRRKDGEELLSVLSQLKQNVEQERSERLQSVQSLERDFAAQLRGVKQQQQQHLEADKDLSSRFEHWCVELRATLDKESGARTQKMEEIDRDLRTTKHAVEKEIRDRSVAIEEITGAQKTARSDVEREIAARKAEAEEFTRNIGQLRQSVEKDARDRARDAEEAFTRRLQTEAEDRQRIDGAVRNLEAELSLKLAGESSERCTLGERLQKRFEEEISRLMGDTDDLRMSCAKQVDLLAQGRSCDERIGELAKALSAVTQEIEGKYSDLKIDVFKFADEFHGAEVELKDRLDSLKQQVTQELEQERVQNSEFFQGQSNRLMQLDERSARELANSNAAFDALQQKQLEAMEQLEESAAWHARFEERLEKSDQVYELYAERSEEASRWLRDSLARVGSDTEVRAVTAATQWMDEAGVLTKKALQLDLQRLWEALDTHTHDVDVAALQQQKGVQPVQVRQVMRAPSPPAMTRVIQRAHSPVTLRQMPLVGLPEMPTSVSAPAGSPTAALGTVVAMSAGGSMTASASPTELVTPIAATSPTSTIAASSPVVAAIPPTSTTTMVIGRSASASEAYAAASGSKLDISSPPVTMAVQASQVVDASAVTRSSSVGSLQAADKWSQAAEVVKKTLAASEFSTAAAVLSRPTTPTPGRGRAFSAQVQGVAYGGPSRPTTPTAVTRQLPATQPVLPVTVRR